MFVWSIIVKRFDTHEVVQRWGYCSLHIVTQSCDRNPARCVVDSWNAVICIIDFCTVFIVVVNIIFTLAN